MVLDRNFASPFPLRQRYELSDVCLWVRGRFDHSLGHRLPDETREFNQSVGILLHVAVHGIELVRWRCWTFQSNHWPFQFSSSSIDEDLQLLSHWVLVSDMFMGHLSEFILFADPFLTQSALEKFRILRPRRSARTTRRGRGYCFLLFLYISTCHADDFPATVHRAISSRTIQTLDDDLFVVVHCFVRSCLVVE